jgi:hypothetical protein
MARFNVAIFVKSLRPRPFRVAGYRNEILRTLRKEGNEIKLLWNKATNTWTPKPLFKVDTRVAGVHAEVTVSTLDKRVFYIDQGTKKRWAVMSNPYSPKSRVRRLQSYRGSGQPIIAGRRAMQARGIPAQKGIAPRLFSVEIRKLRRTKFFSNMRSAMDRAADKSF